MEPPLDSEECQDELMHAMPLISELQTELDEVGDTPIKHDCHVSLTNEQPPAALCRTRSPSAIRAPLSMFQ